MKKRTIFIILSVLFFGSCATLPQKSSSPTVSIQSYTTIDNFCNKHNFQYNFDTIDDLIRIHSQSSDLKILLNSRVGSLNGTTFYLKLPPVYKHGKIYIPRQLDQFISTGKLASFRPTFTIKTIVIDPGHGGKDPGAISQDGLQEKTVNLAISRYLKRELEQNGFKVILTRSKDVFISLRERVEIAKRNNADLFISIHANANRSRQISGVEIYYLSSSRLNNRERSLKIAASENFQGKSMPFDVKAILWDLLITKNYSLSAEFSETLFFTFKNLGFRIRSPIQAPFHVLRFAYVPAVLVETGYLSNRYEAKALRKSYYQKQIAQTISLGVLSLQKRYKNLQTVTE